jgi:hypothetical protein
MRLHESDQVLLLKYADHRLSASDWPRLGELLRSNPAARDYLREVAEQAVMVADIERITALPASSAGQQSVSRTSVDATRVASWRRLVWPLALAACLFALIAPVALRVIVKTDTPAVHVSKVTGMSRFFGSTGKVEQVLVADSVLHAGDTLETRSCDAWVELRSRDTSTVTVAGHSSLRLLDSTEDQQQLELLNGSLWVTPGDADRSESIVIATPAASIRIFDAQCDLQATNSMTIVRVNEGSVLVKRLSDERAVRISAGRQLAIALGGTDSLQPISQPKPTDSWSSRLWEVPEVILGNWLPPQGDERARLGAEPLLWPVSEDESIMLYAVALAAWKSSEQPVLLRPSAHLRVRGRVKRPHMVRFGFSAQKMRGVFAGKFELDVKPEQLGPSGEVWDIELPLADFHPLHPRLATGVDGLELTDVYALTVNDDVGLEIHHIELLGPPGE